MEGRQRLSCQCGLLREGHGVAAQVLTHLGASHGQLREQVLRLAAGSGGDQQSA
jgi:hypothetical protein